MSILLLEFVNRYYGSWILTNWSKPITFYSVKDRITFVGEWYNSGKKKKRNKDKIYDEKVLAELEKIWYLMNFP